MPRHLSYLALVLAVAILLIGALTQRDNPDLLRFEVEGTRAYGFGFTDARSVGVVNDLLRDHPDVDTLVLMNMPGTRDLVQNDRLARRIRRAGLNTALAEDSFIASGAVSLFIAGVERTAECGARIGVHAWSSVGVDAQNTLWDNYADFKRDYLSDMGVSPDFYDFTRAAAPAEGLHIMSPDEINRWGLVTQPLNCAE